MPRCHLPVLDLGSRKALLSELMRLRCYLAGDVWAPFLSSVHHSGLAHLLA